jgi:DNA-binding response OmpR family regulator
MRHTSRILVVAHSPSLAGTLASWLGDSPNEVVLANNYPAAKRQLTAHPDILITEVKLGEYNGLHLALRSHLAGIPTIVLGPDDAVFEHEAELLGATYLSSNDLQSDQLSAFISTVLDVAHRTATPDDSWSLDTVAPIIH